jgi:adenylosuccinate synthase
MFGKKPKSVGLSNEMLGQWEQGIAAASLKDASLSAADAHSALTNTPKDALKGDVESAANKAADAVAKFEKATQSANLIRDPLAKEQALTNVKSAAEQFTKTLEGGKEKFGDTVNFDAMMKQMKEMADKIAEMMAKVAEAIQSIVPGPKR